MPTGDTPDTEKLADRLNAEARRVLPGLQFCAKGGLSSVSDRMIAYVAGLLQENPTRPPNASITEWKELLACLAPHWVIPLLYYKIRELPEEFSPPGEIVDYLRLGFLKSRVRAERLDGQLAKILEAFRNDGVPVLVLKGPALAHGVYPDAAARPHSDLDLLVLPKTMARARKILTGLGYRLLGRRFEFAKPFNHHENYSPPTKSPTYPHIELHWDLTSVHGPGWVSRLQGLFDRAVSVSTTAVTFKTLNPVDALIHRTLSIAWIKYRHLRLIWINDVALLARDLKVPDDWILLQEQCEVWRCRLAMESSLKLAQAWTGLRLPAGFDDFSTWPSADAERKMWTTITSRHIHTLPYLRLLMSNSMNLRELLRGFLPLLFPDPEIMRLSHPPADGWHLPVAYVRRWWRWVSKGGR